MMSLGSYLFLSEGAYYARYYECNKYTIVNFTTFQAANTSIRIVHDDTLLSIVLVTVYGTQISIANLYDIINVVHKCIV